METLCEAGHKNLMYAYPVATDASIRRVLALSRKSNFIVRLDTEEAAAALDRAAAEESTLVNYTIIVDSGFHRFGVKVEQLAAFAAKMRRYKNLVFKGISTHPGHVYGASSEKGGRGIENGWIGAGDRVQRVDTYIFRYH